MDKVRFGIVGVGISGKTYARSLLDGQIKNGVLAAVYDIASAQVEWLKETDIKIFDSAADMFKSGEIDAVLIATPHYFLPPLAMEAAIHNLHVLIESPVGVYTKQVNEMNETLTKCNIIFSVMLQHRTSGAFKAMRQLITDGAVGEVRRTVCYYSQNYYNIDGWRATWKGAGGGFLLNECFHILDLWQWICGMPSKVTAFCKIGKRHDIRVEDEVNAYVEYKNGATGFFTVCTDALDITCIEVIGERGKLAYENGKLKLYLEPDYKSKAVKTDKKPPAHVDVIAAFADNILDKGNQCLKGEEGINGLILSNAMYLSSWLGKTIPLPLDEVLFLSELRKKYVY